MEYVRPLDSNDLRPSFFDLLAQSNFSNLLNSLPPTTMRMTTIRIKLIRAVADLAMLWVTGGTISETVYGLERTSSRGWLLYLTTFLESLISPSDYPLPPLLLRSLRLLDTLIKLAYITADSKYFSLLHALTGITYKHSQSDIYERKDLMGKILKTFLVGGQLVIFLIQAGLLERLKSTTRSKKSTLLSANPPDQSKLNPSPHPNGYPLPVRPGICPCCLEKLSQPVAIKSSGYVYCKRCLNGRNTCPVTLIPFKDLIPLYLN